MSFLAWSARLFSSSPSHLAANSSLVDRCIEPLCTAGIHDFLQKRCKRHLKCAVPSCSSEPDLSLHSNLCSRHTCTYKVLGHDCAYPAVENNRCSDHKKCNVEDCDRVCYKREGEDHFQDKCIIHFNRCPRPNCGRIRRDDGPHCHEHACDVANCPEYKDLLGSIYCRIRRFSVRTLQLVWDLLICLSNV